MERLLHYVWKYKLYAPESLVADEHLPIKVLDPGTHNTNAGPDFFNAKIKIGDLLWAGNIEIHEKASDWFRHKHDKNKAYDSVILHLVSVNDATISRTNGEVIPQAMIEVPEHIKRNAGRLLNSDSSIPCLTTIRNIDPITITSWMDALLSERLERKAGNVRRLLEQYGNDWNEVFHVTLTRSFGFGLNNDAFEQLAARLPYRYILKQRSSISQVEAMLFGLAGMLEETLDCHYYRLLQQEYQFLKRKFELKPMDDSMFKSMRARPYNFPHLKLAQLAALWVKYDTLFSHILEAGRAEEVKELFRVQPSEYWDSHYHFHDKQQTDSTKILGDGALNIILINTVVPILFAYGQRKKQIERCEQAIRLLESLPPEKNRIVSTFVNNGIHICHAGDSQAIIQLKREYCEKKNCLHCRFGFKVLKEKLLN
jgi:hypothetical protein